MARVKKGSIEKLKKEIIEQCKKATNETIDYVYDRFSFKMDDYYNEFDPEIYDRTYQLKHSLKSENASVWKGYFTHIDGKVYLDTRNIDYSWKTLKGIGSWANKYKKNAWTHCNDLEIVRISAFGNIKGDPNPNNNYAHGGYKEGTRIWTDPMNELKSDSYHWRDEYLDNLRKHNIRLRKRR